MHQETSITKVHIRNFLSLRNVELELGKLNVFVGPNASGKSNIARALQLLANHVKLGLPALPGYRDFREIAYGFRETEEVGIEVEAKIGSNDVLYTLTLTANNYMEEVRMNNKEVLRASGTDAGIVLTKRKNIESVRGVTLPVLVTVSVSVPIPLPAGTNLILRTVTPYRSALSELPSEAVDELHALARLLRGIEVYSFSPERIRARSSVRAKPSLGYHGDDLARVLLHLYLERRGVFEEIENVMRSLVPEVEEVIPHLEDEWVEVWLRVRGLEEPLRPFNVSDGTLRMLAYTTALYSGASLVVFEEPENSVHPHLLETLVDLARRAPPQVIIITHSPYLLDHVEPEETYVVEKPGLETTVKKLSKTEEVNAVRKFLEEGGTLGEAWYSGLMGGVPKS